MTMDLTNKQFTMTLAGIWTPTGATDSASKKEIGTVPFYSQITLPNGRAGLVVGGWSYLDGTNQTHYQTNIAIFEQNSDGTLSLATSKYVSDVKADAGNILVSDFNGDGKDDIFGGNRRQP